MEKITVNNWNLVKSEELEGHWITARELGTHLGYSEPGDSVNRIYERHPNSFKKSIDITTVKLTGVTGPKETRVFSERGALKVIRHSNTEVADVVMDEVFNVYLAVRKQAKKEVGPVTPLLPSPETEAASVITGWMQIAREFKVPEHLAQVEAAKAAERRTGVDCTPLLLVAPAQDNVPDEDVFLEVTEIGKRLGVSARTINNFLQNQFLQKRVGSNWIAVGEGKNNSANHQWTNGKKSGVNLKWRVSFVEKTWNEKVGNLH